MPSCGFIRKKPGRVCIGSMDRKIEFVKRNIEPAEVSYTSNRDAVFTVWGDVHTVSGVETFGGVNAGNLGITDIVYIRYRTDLQKGHLAKINGRYLRILAIENLHRSNEFLKIGCGETGETAKESAWQ